MVVSDHSLLVICLCSIFIEKLDGLHIYINEVAIVPIPNATLAKIIFNSSDTKSIPPENPSGGEKRDTHAPVTAKQKQINAANTSTMRS